MLTDLLELLLTLFRVVAEQLLIAQVLFHAAFEGIVDTCGDFAAELIDRLARAVLLATAAALSLLLMLVGFFRPPRTERHGAASLPRTRAAGTERAVSPRCRTR